MLEVEIDGGRDAFSPGESVKGTVQWMLDDAPDAIEVRLLWYTEGRGDQDVGLARTLRIEAPSAMGSSPFELESASGPYSWSGRLISIRWAVEAVAKPGAYTARSEIVLGPEGRALDPTTAARA